MKVLFLDESGEHNLRDYLKTWRGTQPVIPAKAPVIPATDHP